MRMCQILLFCMAINLVKIDITSFILVFAVFMVF